MAPGRQPGLARATVRGTLWTYASFYSGKLLFFLTTVILARLLTKEDFGVAGYALVVMSFLDVMSDLGIGPALIYERENPKAADTAFWLGLGISSTLFVATWFMAPLAGVYFNDARAVGVTRVLALTFPISALSNVHDMLLRKGLAFGRKFIPDLTRATSKGLISIVLAVAGFGPWSLILGQIGGTLFSALAYWRILPWRPSFRFSRDLARALLGYGVKIVSVNTLGILLLNLDYLLIGRFFGAAALGVYTLAFRIPELIIMQFCNVIATVIFPVFSKLRATPQALSDAFLTTTRYVAIVTVPLGLGLALVAKPFVLTLFTAKWAEAIPVMRAISIYALLLSLAYNAGDVYKAQGRPMLLTRISLLKAAILLPALWWAVTGVGTINAVAWTHVAVALAASAINLVVAARVLRTPLRRLVAALGPALLGGVLMAAAVAATLALTSAAAPLVQLVAGTASGAAAYGSALWWLQRELVLEARHSLRAALIRG